jgi:hypothetical protein
VRRCFAPLRSLQTKGVIDRIIYVTWDAANIDAAIAPVLDMPGVELVRIPQPTIAGPAHVQSFTYQRRCFDEGLRLIDDPDALILKLRPDFIFEEAFLAAKILAFDFFCAPVERLGTHRSLLPPSPFSARIWIPWADASQPFFYEDGISLGKRADVALLLAPQTEELIRSSGDPDSHWIVHVMRYIHPFLKSYPILQAYLDEFDVFVMDYDYRVQTMPSVSIDLYFWHLVVAHAWILANSFHVDCGHTGQMKFYPNSHYAKQTTRNLDQIETCSPYNAVHDWRASTQPGGIHACISRSFGRLVDDCWQTELFTAPALRDLTAKNLEGIMERVRDYSDGALDKLEAGFYAEMRQYREKYRREKHPTDAA